MLIGYFHYFSTPKQLWAILHQQWIEPENITSTSIFNVDFYTNSAAFYLRIYSNIIFMVVLKCFNDKFCNAQIKFFILLKLFSFTFCTFWSKDNISINCLFIWTIAQFKTIHQTKFKLDKTKFWNTLENKFVCGRVSGKVWK